MLASFTLHCENIDISKIKIVISNHNNCLNYILFKWDVKKYLWLLSPTGRDKTYIDSEAELWLANYIT